METSARITLLAFMAYSDFWNKNLSDLEQTVANDLDSVSDELEFSEISWGPAGHQGPHERHSDSLIYIVKDLKESEYTLIIRGTSPMSIICWAFQDFAVSGLAPWSRQSPSTKYEHAYVSKATDNSLANLKSLSYNNQTVLEWLIQKISEEGNIKFKVAGHSLGGMMSPAFANYLLDELSGRSLSDRVDCTVYAIAGPTVGNSEYVRQFQTVLRDKFICYVNSYDVVPRVWDEYDMVNVLPTIYSQKDIYPGRLEKECLDFLTTQISGLGYTRLPHVEVVKSEIISFSIFKDYILQALYQHMFPYLVWAKTPESIKVIEKIIEILKHLLEHSEIVRSTDGKAVSHNDKNTFFAEACNYSINI